MKGFLIGIFVGIVGFTGSVILFLRLGFLNPSAAHSPSKFESAQAMKVLDAGLRRHAPRRSNPFPATDENLRAGLRIYEAHCALCHGDRAKPRSAIGLALYPRAPQFLKEAPDMPEYENLYIVQNGIRWTGMPGWKNKLSTNQIWKLITFLAHIDHLPPSVRKQWKASPPASLTAPPMKSKGANRYE